MGAPEQAQSGSINMPRSQSLCAPESSHGTVVSCQLCLLNSCVGIENGGGVGSEIATALPFPALHFSP